MNYRSVTDLSKTVSSNLHRIPRDVDLVVAIPRSGVLAGSFIALSLNIPLVDLEGFIENRRLHIGKTRSSRVAQLTTARDAKHVLIVDDSICLGRAFSDARALLSKASLTQPVTSCAVFAAPESAELVDIAMDVVPMPRVFEWNLMHHPVLGECCIDIDGVLCIDPTPEENDDGPAYKAFLQTARPLVLPTYEIGHLVTSRLEKYRNETTEWLDRNGIQFKQLHMLDLPDAETRRQLNAHAGFKADIYRTRPSVLLFVESDPRQAHEIAQRAGRPVLCFSDHKMYEPGMSVQLAEAKLRNFGHRAARKVKRVTQRMLRQ